MTYFSSLLYRILFLFLIGNPLFIKAQLESWKGAGAKIPDTKNIPIYNVLKTRPALFNDGKTDNSVLLQKLINNYTQYPGQIILYFPKGAYLFNSPVYVKSGRIIKGESTEDTHFISQSHSNVFVIYQPSRRKSNIYKTISRFSKQNNYLIINDIEAFVKSKFVEMFVPNDSLYMEEKWKRKWAKDLIGMMNEVQRISGDTLFLKYPVHIDFPSSNISVKPIDMVENVGFENFSLKVVDSTITQHNFLFINAAHSWIKNVKSEYTGRYHVSIVRSLKITIKDSYFYKSYSYAGGGHGYGVECGYHATNCLIENNIFHTLRHAMMAHLGANGNVFAYNYSLKPTWEENNLTPPDISVHGHYPFYNLFEGNSIEKIACTDYWGKAGPENTFYRNEVRGNGIFVNNADNTIIIGNKFSSKKAVISIKNSKNIKARHNIIGNKIISPIHGPLPSSLYLSEKPLFFQKLKWPPYGDKNKSGILPAQKRYEKIQKSKRKNIFVKAWKWLIKIF
jgi:parallel beta-helix repeat protein